MDRSGSMQTIQADAQGGFNTFIEEQKKEPGKATITLVEFDHEYKVVWDFLDLREVDEYVLRPRGSTALIDAIGRTINMVGERLADMPESQRPSKVIVMIMTDGQENSSCEFTRATINDMITHQTDKYAWDFSFLAANQDAIAEAKTIGIMGHKAMNFNATADGVKASFAQYSLGTRSFRSGASTCVTLPDHAEQETEDETSTGS